MEWHLMLRALASPIGPTDWNEALDIIAYGSHEQDNAHWEVVDALPSYGRGIELPGGRYRSLITGNNLVDVVITGDNGTIDSQGSVGGSTSVLIV
ncbi:hypothetical protein DCAR_0205285 [Daucus carota subsp. sativus]|uniref:Uncharacterized protein n=1 Tax=Daucus carota subsp. sativus TaxID=79200 RepID=A0A175YCX9_DAUCS|nr:PREDICTED: probable polygalacturonase [Daucus carota subsp. sativus]WOG86087.1 hypothetical protein DCAR_0205285 [Daucus carota subsp. sativus]